MQFNSYLFLLIFLPLSLIGYFVLNHFKKHEIAKFYLLLLSIFFYGYLGWKYLFILIPSILLNYTFSKVIQHDTATIAWRKSWLTVGVVFNIGILFYFKYFNFFMENLNIVLKQDYFIRQILIPVGVSYFTFQQIAFLVSSYRKETKQYSLSDYSLFVSFFAYITSGPIAYHHEVIPQFNDESHFTLNTDNLANGMTLFIMGLFKKVIIADTFARAVSWGYGDISILTSMEAFLVSLSFTFQLFFDFSGYSDMAIGIGRMFNISLPINFKSPYQSTSIIEFWNGWHMTLTRFLREYIYFPLGGSRKGRIRTYLNIIIVFLASGLWHGASWHFIIWGLVHGIANVLNRIFKTGWDRFNTIFKWITTFAFINFTWILFRANDMSQAISIIKRILSCDSFSVSDAFLSHFNLTEYLFVFQTIPWLNYLHQHIRGLSAWIFIIGTMTLLLNCRSIEDKKIKLSATQAIFSMILLVWSIVSFSGVSVFLYSNF